MGQEAKEKKRVLVVDDDQVHRYMLSAMLKDWGYQCIEADDGTTAVAAVQQHDYDAVLMDVRMVQLDGITAFRQISKLRPALPVIMMTAYSSVEDAVAVIQQGGHDYLTKPLNFDRLRLALQRAVDHRQVTEKRQQVAIAKEQPKLTTAIIGNSPPMQQMLEMISYVAPTEATVLICGESGTGKELVAEALHENSDRKSGPFIKVNCAALAENLLESELFGHEKGAFTGADSRREGKFVQADGGTLFLDEIGETSQAMQVKLLRALQEREFQRVGGQEVVRVEVRIIAATNRDLEEEVAAGNFREDLYYRLNVVTIVVPPLRERGEDISLLVDHFSRHFAKKNRRDLDSISQDCRKLLQRYPWPGNVRELENALERGIILMRGRQLTEQSLPLSIQKFAKTVDSGGGQGSHAPTSLEEAERLLVLKTLEETGGNKSEAARRLGITRKTLLNKLNRYEQNS